MFEWLHAVAIKLDLLVILFIVKEHMLNTSLRWSSNLICFGFFYIQRHMLREQRLFKFWAFIDHLNVNS